MKRKIVKQGLGAYTVTLPISWVRDNNINQGDLVTITPLDDSLILSSSTQLALKTISCSVQKNDEHTLSFQLTNAYRAGYDVIHLSYAGSQSHVTKIVEKYLLGFDIICKNKNKYTLQSVAEPSMSNFAHLVTRQFYILGQIIQLLPNYSQEIDSYVFKIQCYDNFLKRSLFKRKYVAPQLPFLWQMLSELTHIARVAYNLRTITAKTKPPFSKKDLELCETLLSLVELLKKSHLKQDESYLVKLKETAYPITYDSSLHFPPRSNHVITHTLLSMIRMVYVTRSPMLGMNWLSSVE